MDGYGLKIFKLVVCLYLSCGGDHVDLEFTDLECRNYGLIRI